MDEEKDAEDKDAEFMAKKTEQEKRDAEKTEKNRAKREKARLRKEKGKLGPNTAVTESGDGKKEEKRFKANVGVKRDGGEEDQTGLAVEEQGLVIVDED
jgi:hypothetical protein